MSHLLLLLLLQRPSAVQVRSSVRLMPQNQSSGRGLPPNPTAWSTDQHPAAMFTDVSRHILGRTEGRGLGFGQLVRTHTGKCLKCQSSSDGHSDHNALCAGGRWWSAGPAPVSKLGQGVPDIHRCISSSLHCTESGEESWSLKFETDRFIRVMTHDDVKRISHEITSAEFSPFNITCAKQI